MVTTNPQQAPAQLDTTDYDARSLYSLDTDDGQDHLPEKILTEYIHDNGNIWYLIKWDDCEILRSSWEGRDIVEKYPYLSEAYRIVKDKEKSGQVQPFNISAFNNALFWLEESERQKRVMRRLKHKIQRVLAVVSD